MSLRCGRIKSGCEKGISFKDAVLRNVSFKNVFVKEAVFDGATMDKLTYAVLKGYDDSV